MFLHGDQHDLTLILTIHRTGDNFTAACHFRVPNVRWGLKDPSLLFLTVSNEVMVEVNAVVHVTWAPGGRRQASYRGLLAFADTSCWRRS